jgi:hypothetical protein
VLALSPPLFPALPAIAAAALVELIPAAATAPAPPGGLLLRPPDQGAGCLVDVPAANLWAIHDRYFSAPPVSAPGA